MFGVIQFLQVLNATGMLWVCLAFVNLEILMLINEETFYTRSYFTLKVEDITKVMYLLM